MKYRCLAWIVCLLSACVHPGLNADLNKPIFPVKIGTYNVPRQHGVTDLFIHSPWEPTQYARLGLPEHCWGVNLPNTSHDSDTLVSSPWRISLDSTRAVFERQPRTGVTFIARAETDSMAVRLSIQIVNDSDQPIANVRSLVCFKPDATINTPSREDGMLAFRDTSYQMTFFPSGGRKIHLHEETTYHGDYPPGIGESNLRYKINWGVNIKGQPDVRSMDVGAWFLGKNPGRIVEERADPALIAIHADGDTTRWIGLIWDPPRVLFCNPFNPCFHSDPNFADCPPCATTGAQGIIFFHDGTFESLVQRAMAWKASLTH